MSGRINYSNLSDSLKEHLNGLGLTEEQVNELIENALVEINEKDVEQDEVVNGLVDKVGELNGLMTEEKGDLVGAINELFQSANNGKQLIANAIGEPLSSEDTFSAMSNDINGLLSTFKTNMMNNGITVESGDKFKSLIDKIATMAEEGDGKGIQFVTGEFVASTKGNQNVTYDFNFTPNIVFAVIDSCSINNQVKLKPMAITNIQQTNTYNGSVGSYYNNYITDVSSTGFVIKAYVIKNSNIKWYAIGVGEEDTTLRDSLASILQEEGVSVTEEDDMASLIGKVDSEFTKDNNQINSLTSELAGKVTPAGNAVAANVLSGKTFINSTGQVVTGTMANMSTHTQVADYVAWNTDSIYLGIPAGAYVNASSTGYPEVYINKTRLDSNLVPGNIVSGKSICGVNGTATAIKVSAGSRFTFYSNTTRSGYFSNANYSNSTGYQYTLEFDGTYTVTGSMYTSYNSVTLYVKVVLADSSGNIIQEFGESSHKTGSTNGGYANTGNLTITGKAGQIIMLYGKCHYSKNTSKAGSHNFNGLTVTGEITKA